MNIQLTVVVALHPLRNTYRKKFWHKIPKTREKFSFSSVLSYIFISYEYSKNRTRMLGKSIHGNFVAKREKSIRFPCFIFKSMHGSLFGAFFPNFTPDAANTLTGVNELLPLWEKAGSEASNIVPQVLWQSALQPDPLPSWFLKTRPSRVSPGYPAPHHHPSQLTLPSFLLQPNMVCDRTITVPPELCLPPWLQSLFKKKKKSEKAKRAPCCWLGWGWIVS